MGVVSAEFSVVGRGTRRGVVSVLGEVFFLVMEDWYVSDSENDEGVAVIDEPKPECVISLTLDKVFGGNIDSTKMIELLQRINLDKCLDLDCTGNYMKERQQKRTKRKRKKRDSFPDGEISETTSEMISTQTPSTGGDCRDTRRFAR